MGEEPTVRYYGNSHSERRRRKSGEYRYSGHKSGSNCRRSGGLLGNDGMVRREGGTISPGRSDCPSRRWGKSLTRKDDTRSEISMRSNRPRRDPYPVPRGYLVLVSDIVLSDILLNDILSSGILSSDILSSGVLCKILCENSALGNDVPPYDCSLSDTDLYSCFAKYFLFLRRYPDVIP